MFFFNLLKSLSGSDLYTFGQNIMYYCIVIVFLSSVKPSVNEHTFYLNLVSLYNSTCSFNKKVKLALHLAVLLVTIMESVKTR